MKARQVIGGVVAAVLLLVLGLVGCGARRATLADAFAAANRGDRERAVALYRSIAEESPNTPEGAIAFDAYIELSGQRLFPVTTYECSADASARYAEAERLFVAGNHSSALHSYEAALEVCPQNALWWVHAGDAYFALGDYGRARTLYMRGLDIDRWNRSGHRFLADADFKLGNLRAAYDSAIMAVLSDPTYAAGWQSLQEITLALGGQFTRDNLGHKPWIEEGNGKPTIHMSAAYGSAASTTAWLRYALLRYAFTALRDPDGEASAQQNAREEPLLLQAEWDAMSPLERERFLFHRALEAYAGYVAQNPGTETRNWEAMRRAAALGFTDEAIYINLMDAELAPSYLEFREANAGRLVEYLETVVAPLPRPEGREAHLAPRPVLAVTRSPREVP